MKKLLGIFVCAAAAFIPLNAVADVQVSGLADFVFRNSKEFDVTNNSFRDFSNFHTSRTRLFFDGNIGDNADLFAQILVDGYGFQLYGAYARFSNLAGNHLHLNVGLIPPTVGSYAPRTYSDKNPLIGTPLLYNFHTALDPNELGAIGTFGELEEAKEERYDSGLPFIYDACWNSGVEFYGTAGKLDYSLGLLIGSVSKPMQQQDRKDVPQLTTHFTYNFSPGLKAGLSAFAGPYLSDALFDEPGAPADINANDFLNTGIGYEFYFSARYLEIYSEGFSVNWEYPGLPDLGSVAAYIEAKYKIQTRWYAAARFDLVEPGRIEVAPGVEEKWDNPLKRYEFGLGYKPMRGTTVKLVAQLNKFDIDQTFNSELVALQISALFN